jgi:gluconolactonase
MRDRFKRLLDGVDHAEGVAWAPDGVIYAGGEAGQVYRASLDGSLDQIATTGGRVLGLALDAAGRIYACDARRHEVLRIDPADGSVEPYSAGTPDRPMRLPNYPAFDDAGNLYVTDSGGRFANDGLIFRVAPGGAAAVWSQDLPHFPNGCCLNRQGDALLVLETDRPGVYRLPIGADGSAGAPELMARLPGGVPDGIAAAEDESFYVASYRPDVIHRVTSDGDVDVFAEDALGWFLAGPTNIAFGGPDLRHLVVANLGSRHLSIGAMDVAGIALRYPALD